MTIGGVNQFANFTQCSEVAEGWDVVGIIYRIWARQCGTTSLIFSMVLLPAAIGSPARKRAGYNEPDNPQLSGMICIGEKHLQLG